MYLDNDVKLERSASLRMSYNEYLTQIDDDPEEQDIETNESVEINVENSDNLADVLDGMCKMLHHMGFTWVDSLAAIKESGGVMVTDGYETVDFAAVSFKDFGEINEG